MALTNTPSPAATANDKSPKRWWHRFGHSLKWRLVALFLLLALAVGAVFLHGLQKAMGVGWRDAVRPLLSDYVDRLAADLGTPPDVAKAQRLVDQLPLSVRISGPVVNFDSHPRHQPTNAHATADINAPANSYWRQGKYGRDTENARLLQRKTADGHVITFGLGDLDWRGGPGSVAWVTLLALLGLTALAFLYVRRLLRPLDAIGAGAKRIGAGDFSEPITLKRREESSELGDLARQINTMGGDIHQMLEAKRGLLLAVSHELRSPLTRARLNIELLPEGELTQAPREALKRDVAEMARLISDLLESERLSSRHAALHTEPTDLAALVRDVGAGLAVGTGAGAPATALRLDLEDALPLLQLDPVRIRLLLRNLIDNALRYNPTGAAPVEITLRRTAPPRADRGPTELVITVRDHGPGVPEAQLANLTEPFFRLDAARERRTGGVGLGLHLCKLVAQAHGGTLALQNVSPGLQATVCLPGAGL